MLYILSFCYNHCYNQYFDISRYSLLLCSNLYYIQLGICSCSQCHGVYFLNTPSIYITQIRFTNKTTFPEYNKSQSRDEDVIHVAALFQFQVTIFVTLWIEEKRGKFIMECLTKRILRQEETVQTIIQSR